MTSRFLIDVTPAEDTVFHPEGPATFSLSVFLDGDGTLSVDGAVPFALKPGAAVLFACNRQTRGEIACGQGEDCGSSTSVSKPLCSKTGGVSLARLGGPVMTQNSLPEQDVFLVGFKAPPELIAAATSLLQCRYEQGMARQLHLYSKAVEALSIGLDVVARGKTGKPVRNLNPDEMRKLDAAVAIIEAQYSTDWTIRAGARGRTERKTAQGSLSHGDWPLHPQLSSYGASECCRSLAFKRYERHRGGLHGGF